MIVQIVSFLLIFCSITPCLEANKDTSFDILILTQHWPYTTCMAYQEHGKGHQCKKIERSRWTVHGLWPTQFGKIAPSFCNETWKFEVKKLEPIMDEMNLYWPDVEMRDVKNSLWDHEWSKHGTCAAQLQNTSTEIDYFKMGCNLAKDNNLTDWLQANGVIPSEHQTYSTKHVWDAVLKGTGGKRPHIDCVRVDGEAYINEIKVCYDKKFQRVDCDGIKGLKEGHMMGSCLKDKSFFYPNTTDPISSPSDAGMIAGVICTILALTAVGFGLGYGLYRRARTRGRGYESL